MSVTSRIDGSSLADVSCDVRCRHNRVYSDIQGSMSIHILAKNERHRNLKEASSAGAALKPKRARAATSRDAGLWPDVKYAFACAGVCDEMPGCSPRRAMTRLAMAGAGSSQA